MLHRLLEFEHFLILEHFSFTKILWGIFWHIKTHRDCWYLCSFRMVMKASCLPLFWDREFAQKKESVSFKSEGQETNQLNNGSITQWSNWNYGTQEILGVLPQVPTKWENWLSLTCLQFSCWCLAPSSASLLARCTQARKVFTPRANVKDAAAESFKSRRCETITIPHSETAFLVLFF